MILKTYQYKYNIMNEIRETKTYKCYFCLIRNVYMKVIFMNINELLSSKIIVLMIHIKIIFFFLNICHYIRLKKYCRDFSEYSYYFG